MIDPLLNETIILVINDSFTQLLNLGEAEDLQWKNLWPWYVSIETPIDNIRKGDFYLNILRNIFNWNSQDVSYT